MVHESLADQLRRVGILPALAVILAAGLATFALLDRLMPISAHSLAPRVVPPSASQADPPVPTAAGHVTGTDPLAVAQRTTVRTQTAFDRANLKRARALARRQSRLISTAPRTSTTLPRVIPLGKAPHNASKSSTPTDKPHSSPWGRK